MEWKAAAAGPAVCTAAAVHFPSNVTSTAISALLGASNFSSAAISDKPDRHRLVEFTRIVLPAAQPAINMTRPPRAA
jgi:hypothetical protein